MKIYLPNPFVRMTHDSYMIKNPIKKRAISRLLPSYKKLPIYYYYTYFA